MTEANGVRIVLQVLSRFDKIELTQGGASVTVAFDKDADTEKRVKLLATLLKVYP